MARLCASQPSSVYKISREDYDDRPATALATHDLPPLLHDERLGAVEVHSDMTTFDRMGYGHVNTASSPGLVVGPVRDQRHETSTTQNMPINLPSLPPIKSPSAQKLHLVPVESTGRSSIDKLVKSKHDQQDEPTFGSSSVSGISSTSPHTEHSEVADPNLENTHTDHLQDMIPVVADVLPVIMSESMPHMHATSGPLRDYFTDFDVSVLGDDDKSRLVA